MEHPEKYADCQQAASILRSLVSGSAFPHFNGHSKLEEPPVLIDCTDRLTDESCCPTNGVVVTIAGDAMHGWRHEQLDRGPLPLHRWRIDGLFGFITQVIWPRFLSDRRMSRFMALENPPVEYQSLLDKHRQLSNEVRRVQQVAIRDYLGERGLDLHQRVYNAIVKRDWRSLLEFEASRELNSTGITRKDMAFAIPLLKDPNEEIAMRGAVGLTGMLLQQVVQRDIAEGRFGGMPVSDELRRVKEQHSECNRAIRVTANAYYATAFLTLATSENLVKQEQELLHAYRWDPRMTQDYLPRLQAWHAEQISSTANPSTPA